MDSQTQTPCSTISSQEWTTVRRFHHDKHQPDYSVKLESWVQGTIRTKQAKKVACHKTFKPKETAIANLFEVLPVEEEPVAKVTEAKSTKWTAGANKNRTRPHIIAKNCLLPSDLIASVENTTKIEKEILTHAVVAKREEVRVNVDLPSFRHDGGNRHLMDPSCTWFKITNKTPTGYFFTLFTTPDSPQNGSRTYREIPGTTESLMWQQDTITAHTLQHVGKLVSRKAKRARRAARNQSWKEVALLASQNYSIALDVIRAADSIHGTEDRLCTKTMCFRARHTGCTRCVYHCEHRLSNTATETKQQLFEYMRSIMAKPQCLAPGCQNPSHDACLRCLIHCKHFFGKAQSRPIDIPLSRKTTCNMAVKHSRKRLCGRYGCYQLAHDRCVCCLEHCPNKLTGEAQIGISIPNMPVIPDTLTHIVKIPAVEELVRMLQVGSETPINWAVISKEIGFFFTHMYNGGFTFTNLFTSVAHLLSNLPLSHISMDWIKQMFGKNAQNGNEESLGVLATIIGIVGTIIAGCFTTALPSTKTVDVFMSRFAQLGRMIQSYEKIADYSTKIAETLISFIKVSILGYDKDDLQEWAGINAWCEEVTRLNTPDFEIRVTREPELTQTVTNLIQRGQTILKLCDNLKISPLRLRRVQSCCMYLMKCREIVSASNTGATAPRVAPIVLHFVGDTGAGKSTMLPFLNAKLLHSLGSRKPEDLVDKVYYRYAGSDFFDGYRNGTEIVVCDDFGAQKDSESHPSNEPLEQIRFGNSAPFAVPMAHLLDKGNTIFEAKCVIWTSNRESFSFQSLTNPEAITNRVSLRYRQRPAEGYGKEKNINGQTYMTLDSAKVTLEAATDPTVYRKCIVFDQLETTGKAPFRVMRENISFDDMAQECCDAMANKQTQGNKFLSEVATFFNGLPQAGEHPNAHLSGLGVPELPITTFHEPSLLLRGLGAQVHINVFKTILSARPAVVKYDQEEIRIEDSATVFGAPCLKVSYRHAQAVVQQLVYIYSYYGKYNQIPKKSIELILQRAQVCNCYEHRDDYTEKFAQRLRNTLTGLPSDIIREITVTRRQVSESKMTIFESPLFKLAVSAVIGVIAAKLATKFFGTPVEVMEKAANYFHPNAATIKYEGAYSNNAAPVRGKVEEAEGAYSNNAAPVRGKVERCEDCKFTAPELMIDGHCWRRDCASGKRQERMDKAKPSGTAESLSDQNAFEVRRKVYNNMYSLQCRDSVTSEWVHAGSVTMISGRVGVTNRHIVSNLGQLVKIVRAQDLGTFEMTLKDLNWTTLPDESEILGFKDIALIEFPVHVPIHSSLTKFFMTKEDFAMHRSLKKVSYIGFDPEMRVAYKETSDCVAEHRSAFELLEGEGRSFIRQFYRYAIETKPGDCGGLMIAFDPRFNRKIFGIHMAGTDHPLYTGIACALHIDTINALFAQLKLRWEHSVLDGDVAVDVPIQVNAEGGFLSIEKPFPGQYQHIGKTHTRLHQSVATALRPSPVAGITGPVTKMPAKLAPFHVNGEVVDPFAIAQKKATTANCSIDASALAAAVNSTSQMINLHRSERDQQTMTFREAISGVEGDEWYPPINRGTSPGFGWIKSGKGKTKWLGTDDYVYDHPELLARYNSAVEKLQHGQRVGSFWSDTLKDELRPIEKVMAGKTRLFAAGEMVQTILLRRYFGGFAAHLARNRIHMESCVGINPYSNEWTDLAFRMQTHGKPVVAGDFTNYDGSLTADSLWAAKEVIDAFYNDGAKQNKLRSLLWCEIVNSVHVHGNDVYQWSHSQPSGCPITSILNSLVHSIIVRVVYVLCARKYRPELQSLTNFDNYVALACYGDDDLLNISPEIVTWFNQETMTEAFATFGMTYTDELKTGKMVPYKTLETVQFLKRKFVWCSEEARFRAPLALETIQEMSSWVRKGDPWALSAQTIEMAVYELSQYDKATWDKLMPLFIEARNVIATKHHFTLATYEEYRKTDQVKYQGTETKLRDRGFAQTAETRVAANPAEVVGVSDQRVGGLFSSRVERVPTQNNRLFDLPKAAWCEFAGRAQTIGLAQPTSTMAPGSSAQTTEQQSGPNFSGEETKVEKQEIMQFHQDGGVSKGLRDAATRASKRYVKDADDSLRNAIINFLQRPVHIQDFTWASSTGSLGILFEKDLPTNWIDVQMITEKLSGFRYLRCDFVVEVQINAQPFNAGAAILWYEPLSSQMTNGPSSTIHLGGITGYPHTIYRCGDATSVQLRIPYHGILSHYDLVTGDGTAGKILFDVISPLTGASDVDGTMWIWAENIDISVPTGLPVKASAYSGQAQSGRVPLDPEVHWDDEMQTEVLDMNPESAPDMAKADGTAPERKKNGKGFFETGFKIVSGIAASFLPAPALAPFAAMSSAVFSAASAVSHFFGWSKPIDNDSPQKTQLVANQHMMNFNGDSKARKLALDVNNAVDIPTEVFNTDEDEMAFSTILKRPIYTDMFTMSADQPQGTLLWSWPVDPCACKTTSQTDPGPPPINYQQRQETYLSYISQQAGFWRGTICYDLRAIKTVFHSGRIRVTFVPGARSTTAFSSIDINKCYSQVFDLRKETDSKVCVPFTFNMPWKQTLSEDEHNMTLTDPIGYIYVTVVNALRAPTTAATAIEFLVFSYAGEDFQLAYPRVPIHLRVLRDDIDVKPITYSGRAQSNILTVSGMKGFDPNSIAIGEVFTGYRQWLKRMIQVADVSKPYTQALPANLRDQLQFQLSPFHLATQLYRFQSGPLRFLTERVNEANQTVYIAPANAAIPPTGPKQNGIPVAVVPGYIEPIAEFEVPFYQQWPAIPTIVGVPVVDDGYFSPTRWTSLPYNYGTSVYVSASTTSYLSTGEGFSFGFLIGPPMTAWVTTT